VQSPRSAR